MVSLMHARQASRISLLAFFVLIACALSTNAAFAAPTDKLAPAASASASPAGKEADDDEAPAPSQPKVPWKDGPQSLDLGNGVRVALPEGYSFLAQPDAGRLLEKAGNLHNENLLGIVVSQNDDDYFISFRYEDAGFVKDDEKLDAKELLDAIREGEDEYNEERKKLGFAPIHADGWLEDPRYDKANHYLVWTLGLSSTDGASANLNTRVLGRRGYVSVNLVADKDELPKFRNAGSDLLRATSFAPGDRYEDFDSSKDKVAEYGLTGLILGGAGLGLAKAAKIGLLAKFWKVIVGVLIAGKKGIVALLAAGGAAAKKFFGGKKSNATSGDAAP